MNRSERRAIWDVINSIVEVPGWDNDPETVKRVQRLSNSIEDEKTYDHRGISPETHEMILDLNRQGYTRKKIAQEVDISISQVRSILRNSGVEEKRKKERRNQKILFLYQKGESFQKIAEMTKVSEETVKRIAELSITQ